MQTDFSEQMRVLEEILGRDFVEARELYRKHLIRSYVEEQKKLGTRFSEDTINKRVLDTVFVRQDSSAYLNKGKRQLVLKLNEGWVAKAANYFEFEDFYLIRGTSYITDYYSLRVIDTVQVIEDKLGFDIPAVITNFKYEAAHVRLGVIEDGLGIFVIVPDLTEGGKYIVRDIKPDEDFIEFSNTRGLRRNLDNYVTRLVKLYGRYRESKVEGWNAELHGHIEAKGTPEGAIRRMFFLKIDPNTQHGEIVPGDFNHAFFYKRERDRKR